MAAQEALSNTPIEGWRMALLLLGFATLTLVLEKTFHNLERAFQSRRGLSIALEHIKNELLFVGSISLLLSAFQNLLAQICIPKYDVSIYTDRRRRLLAGGYNDYCGPSKQSLWPVSLQHDTHIFIFVVACTHVVYGTFTVYLTLWRVRSWRKWEEEAQVDARQKRDMKVMQMPHLVQLPNKFFYRHVGSNPVIHFFLMLFRQYRLSVNPSLYNNARVLYIEKNGREYDFDFHGLIVRSLEDELMHTLHPEWHLWMIAVVWYAIPPPSYVSFWMYGIALLIIMLVGGKLVDILVEISVQVARKYGDSVAYGRMDKDPRAYARHKELGRSSMRVQGSPGASIQQQFMETVSKLFESTAKGSAAAETAPAATLPGRQPPLSGKGSLGRMSSREEVLYRLRSLATERSCCGVFPEKQCSERAAEPQAAETGIITSMGTATTGAGVSLGGQGSRPGNDGGASSSPRHGMGLVRLSAPAQLRGQAGNRFRQADVSAVVDHSGDTNTPVAQMTPRAMKGGLGGVLSQHRQNHHYQDRQDQHSQNQVNTPRIRLDRVVDEGDNPYAQQHHHHHHEHQQNQQQQTAANANDSKQKHAKPMPRAQMARRLSPFELFQHHPGHQARALSLRRALDNVLGPHEVPIVPTRTPPGLPKQQRQSESSPALLPQSLTHRRQQDLPSMRQSGLAVVARNGAVCVNGLSSSPTRNTANAATVLVHDAVSRTTGSPASTVAAAAANVGMSEIAAANSGEGLGMELSGGRGPMIRNPSSQTHRVMFADQPGHDSSDDEGRVWHRFRALRPRRTPSGRRRKVPLLMRPFYCGAYVQRSHEYEQEVIRSRNELVDATELFWFKRPRLTTMFFTLAYFQNSLSIAICIFSLTGLHDSISTWQAVPKWAVILQLCLDIVLVPQVSLSILPFYALIQPLGSHCPQKLNEFAKTKDLEAKKAKYGRMGFAGRWAAQWSSQLPWEIPERTEDRSILNFMRFLRRNKAKKGKRQSEVAAAPEAPPAAVTSQLSNNKRVIMAPDAERSLTESAQIGYTSEHLEAHGSSGPFSEARNVNGILRRTAGAPALRPSASRLRHNGPQPAELQSDTWAPARDVNGIVNLSALNLPPIAVRSAGDQPQMQLVESAESEREPETALELEATAESSGCLRASQVEIAIHPLEPATVSAGVTQEGPSSQRSGDINTTGGGRGGSRDGSSSGKDSRGAVQSVLDGAYRVTGAAIWGPSGDLRRPDACSSATKEQAIV